MAEPSPWDKINAKIKEEQPQRNLARLNILEEERKVLGGKKNKELDKAIEHQKININNFESYTKRVVTGKTDKTIPALTITGAESKVQQTRTLFSPAFKELLTPKEETKSSPSGNLSPNFKSLLGIVAELPQVPKPVEEWAQGVQERMKHPLEALAKAISEHTNSDIDQMAMSFVGAGVTKAVYKNFFQQGAIDKAIKKSLEGTTHTLVNLKIDDFLKLAYPLSKTREDLSKAVKEVPSMKELATNLVGRKKAIKEYVEQGGVNELPTLRIEGGSIVSHEGRTRALVAREMGLTEFPVVILDDTGRFAKGSMLHQQTISESGEAMVETKKLYNPVK